MVVELKAISGLEGVHLAQAINYLEAFGLEVGNAVVAVLRIAGRVRAIHVFGWSRRDRVGTGTK